MKTNNSTMAVERLHDLSLVEPRVTTLNARLFDQLLEHGLIDDEEHARALKQPYEKELSSCAEALAALVWSGQMTAEAFSAALVRARAGRRMVNGEARLGIVGEATRLLAEREALLAQARRSQLRSVAIIVAEVLFWAAVALTVYQYLP
jgi:hypothetical protein